VIVGNNGAIKEQSDYYPFGMRHDNTDLMISTNRWGYNGKEKQTVRGLNFLDYGNRMYDDFTGRWPTPDPLSEKYYSISPYVYCFNNPIRFIDPDGMQPFGSRGLLPINPLQSIGTMLEHYGWNSKIRTFGYAMQHPRNASLVGQYKEKSSNITTIASNFEINIAISANLERGEGTQGNAIRHTLWQSIITKEFGTEHAKRIGNAHENNPKTDLTQREFTTMEDADQTVDLLNNEIGRNIAEQNTGATNVELATAVMDEYKNNGLWTVSGNKKDGYTIQRTAITNEQYEAAIREINRKNETGRNR
jgi:RHS repeat-associated protein